MLGDQHGPWQGRRQSRQDFLERARAARGYAHEHQAERWRSGRIGARAKGATCAASARSVAGASASLRAMRPLTRALAAMFLLDELARDVVDRERDRAAGFAI
ncbi:hypothetical protein [Methylosinus trichosporium]|uniref:hypothetical protein n=1 Tax=Methylosinus trichosporium TaxID=426 RepID=UPI001FCE962C|nr:hypothetical protein [Methylosinus trichosporium]